MNKQEIAKENKKLQIKNKNGGKKPQNNQKNNKT